MEKVKSINVGFDCEKRAYGQKNKDRIFDVSIRLFSEKGFEAVSIRDITAEIGIKQSSLYNHFNSKEAIIKEIYRYFRYEVEHAFPAYEQLGTVAAEATPEGFFRRGAELFFLNLLSPRMERVWRILFVQKALQDREAAELIELIYARSLQYIGKALEIMMELGKIKRIDAAAYSMEYTYPLNFMFYEYIISKAASPDRALLEDLMRRHADYFCAVLEE